MISRLPSISYRSHLDNYREATYITISKEYSTLPFLRAATTDASLMALQITLPCVRFLLFQARELQIPPVECFCISTDFLGCL